MGALHEGHLALVDTAQRHADAVAVSIFVNPLQFGPTEDLVRYPRTLEADLDALRARGVAYVFVPSAEEMYPAGHVTGVTTAPHAALFEGAIRPGHFAGVLTVVNKLFHIIQPDVAVFGQKDLQQLSLIRRMVRDLNIPIEIVDMPTVRDLDGVAMSSRNRYLSPDDRLRAACMYVALCAIRKRFESGQRDGQQLLDTGRAILTRDPHVAIDYLALVDPGDFSSVATAVAGAAAVLAVRLTGNRLLDNIIL